jgi:hypothetical protein
VIGEPLVDCSQDQRAESRIVDWKMTVSVSGGESVQMKVRQVV